MKNKKKKEINLKLIELMEFNLLILAINHQKEFLMTHAGFVKDIKKQDLPGYLEFLVNAKIDQYIFIIK